MAREQVESPRMMNAKQAVAQARDALVRAERNHAEAMREQQAAREKLATATAAAIEAGVGGKAVDVDDLPVVRADRRVAIATASLALAQDAVQAADEVARVERFREREGAHRAAVEAFGVALDAAAEASAAVAALRSELCEIHGRLAGTVPVFDWNREFTEGGRLSFWRDSVTDYFTPPPVGPPQGVVVRALGTLQKGVPSGRLVSHNDTEEFHLSDADAAYLIAAGCVERVSFAAAE